MLEQSTGAARWTVRLGDDLVHFQGHFPGKPILPGVAQVDWAIRLARRQFGDLGSFASLERLKFQAIAVPGEILELALEWDAATGLLNFSFVAGGRRKSTGRVRFQR